MAHPLNKKALSEQDIRTTFITLAIEQAGMRRRVIARGKLAPEYLVMGHLMRRNVLTYNAANSEGHDLICTHPDHPDPRTHRGRVVRVRAKSRHAPSPLLRDTTHTGLGSKR